MKLRMPCKERLFLGGLGLLLVTGLLGLVIRSKLIGVEPATAQPIKQEPVTLPWDTPPGYRIVYLLAEGAVSEDSLLAPSRLEATLGVQTVYRWRDVPALDEKAFIEALIIHESALPLVDREWVSRAYRRGVVIAAFNIYVPQLADLIGDPCIAKDGFASEPYPGSFYVIVSLLIFGQPEDVARINEERKRSCNEESPPGITYPTRLVGGRSTYELTDISGYNIFAQVLVSHIEDMKLLR